MLSVFKFRINRIVYKSKIRTLAMQTCLNNREIISKAFKNLDSSKIAGFAKLRTFNRMILNSRDQTIINFDSVGDILESLKLR